jgi:hypothetical protein
LQRHIDQEGPKSLAEQAASASWWCAFPHGTSVKQIFPRNKYQCWDIPFAHVIGPLCEFLVPKPKILLQNVTFRIIWRHTELCEDRTKYAFRIWLPAIFPCIEEILECMYKARRWVVWKWSHSQKIREYKSIFYWIWLIHC